MKKVFITLEKFKSLKQEVKNLKLIDRKVIADKLSQYRDSVDLSEDSSYADVLLEQANLEEKIDEIEEVLENASIIKERKSGKVRLGSTVVLKGIGHSKKVIFKIVGPVDADPLNHAISNESPLGKALIGKKKDEIVQVSIPTGINKYKIIDIQ